MNTTLIVDCLEPGYHHPRFAKRTGTEFNTFEDMGAFGGFACQELRLPIISGRDGRTTRGSRRWLVIWGLVFGLLLLPLVPFVTPVDAHLGDCWFWAYAKRDLDHPQWLAVNCWHPPRSWGAVVVPSSVRLFPLVSGIDYYEWGFQCERWRYAVFWFRGRAIPRRPVD